MALEPNYIAEFERKQEIVKYILYGFFFILLIGIPLWGYLYFYFETLRYGIEKLGVERYNDRLFSTFLLALGLLFASSIVAIPSLIILKARFDTYHKILNQLKPSEIEIFKAIENTVIFYEKYMPPFIITEHILYVFSLNQYNIPFRNIKSYKISEIYVKHLGRLFKIEITTSDGKRYEFTTSDSQIQREELEMKLQSIKI